MFFIPPITVQFFYMSKNIKIKLNVCSSCLLLEYKFNLIALKVFD